MFKILSIIKSHKNTAEKKRLKRLGIRVCKKTEL